MRYVFLTGFAIALFIMAFNPYRDFMVSGFVKDPGGMPLSGVTVSEKQNGRGIHEGTVSGDDGSFSLTVSSKNPVLVFQMTGYKKQELKVKHSGKIIQI